MKNTDGAALMALLIGLVLGVADQAPVTCRNTTAGGEMGFAAGADVKWGNLPTNSVVDGLDSMFRNVDALALTPSNADRGAEE